MNKSHGRERKMKKKLMMLGLALFLTVTSVWGGNRKVCADQAEGMKDTAVTAEQAARTVENAGMRQHVTRVAGNDRYETAIRCAELMRGDGTFEDAVIASADNFPDALAGSYLAGWYDAPILLAGKSEAGTRKTLDYIDQHVSKGGIVYLLGGTGAVPEYVEQELLDSGFRGDGVFGDRVVRLAGASRYETNLAIVNRVSYKPERVIIASGKNYADSLSVSTVSATEYIPIILAGDSLTEEAVETIRKIGPSEIYLIGGTGAVNETVEAQAKELCGTVERIAGRDRYATSLAIAEYFNPYPGIRNAVFAYGGNFPDGLTGGALAGSLYAPVILVSDSNYAAQETYIKEYLVEETYVMGGTSAISDETMAHLAGMGEKEEEPDNRITIVIDYYLNGGEEPYWDNMQYKVEPGTVVDTASFDKDSLADFIESPYAMIEGETFTASAEDDWAVKNVYITAEYVTVYIDVYLDGEYWSESKRRYPRGILIDTVKRTSYDETKTSAQGETFLAEEGARGAVYFTTLKQK